VTKLQLISTALLCLVLGALGPPARAQTCDAIDRHAIVYINGVFRSPSSVLDAVPQLQMALDRPEERDILVTGGFNVSSGHIGDLYEALLQAEGMSPQDVDLPEFLLRLRGLSTGSTGFVNFVQNYVDSMGSRYDQDSESNRAVLRDSVVVNGHKTLVVGHSQGTHFANELYEHFRDHPETGPYINSIGLYGVAPAASAILHREGTPLNRLYIKHDADILSVIGVGLAPTTELWSRTPPERILPPSQVPGIFDQAVAFYRAIELHFIDLYLDDNYNLLERVVEDIRARLPLLQDPRPPCEEPPPPTPGSFPPYLPSTLSGLALNVAACQLPPSAALISGSLTLGADGTYTGNGCLANFQHNTYRDYGFTAYEGYSCRVSSGEVCRTELRADGVSMVRYASNGNLQLGRLQFALPESAWPTYSPSGFTASSTPSVDAKSRVLGWLHAIQGLSCVSEADRVNVPVPTHRLVVAGDTVSLVGAGGVVGSIDADELVGNFFHESRIDSRPHQAPFADVLVQSWGSIDAATGTMFSTNMSFGTDGNSTVRRFNLSLGLRDSSGAPIGRTCETWPPP